MSDIVNPFMQSIGEMFLGRVQREHEKEMKTSEDAINAREKFKDAVGVERYGDAIDLWMLVQDIRLYINNQKNQTLSNDQAKTLLDLLNKLKLVKDDELHPYEVPALYHYKILLEELKKLAE